MKDFIHIPANQAEKDHWNFTNDFVDGENVQTLNFKFRPTNRSVVFAKIKGYEEHGWIKAAGDRCYYCLSGKGQIFTKDRVVELTAGDAFMVYANTEYNYKATTEKPLEIILFMNDLWEE
jgi:mannose-6-phosphate isomerase-like protein (cupin superfamily)